MQKGPSPKPLSPKNLRRNGFPIVFDIFPFFLHYFSILRNHLFRKREKPRADLLAALLFNNESNLHQGQGWRCRRSLLHQAPAVRVQNLLLRIRCTDRLHHNCVPLLPQPPLYRLHRMHSCVFGAPWQRRWVHLFHSMPRKRARARADRQATAALGTIRERIRMPV